MEVSCFIRILTANTTARQPPSQSTPKLVGTYIFLLLSRLFKINFCQNQTVNEDYSQNTPIPNTTTKTPICTKTQHLSYAYPLLLIRSLSPLDAVFWSLSEITILSQTQVLYDYT